MPNHLRVEQRQRILFGYCKTLNVDLAWDWLLLPHGRLTRRTMPSRELAPGMVTQAGQVKR